MSARQTPVRTDAADAPNLECQAPAARTTTSSQTWASNLESQAPAARRTTSSQTEAPNLETGAPVARRTTSSQTGTSNLESGVPAARRTLSQTWASNLESWALAARRMISSQTSTSNLESPARRTTSSQTEAPNLESGAPAEKKTMSSQTDPQDLESRAPAAESAFVGQTDPSRSFSGLATTQASGSRGSEPHRRHRNASTAETQGAMGFPLRSPFDPSAFGNNLYPWPAPGHQHRMQPSNISPTRNHSQPRVAPQDQMTFPFHAPFYSDFERSWLWMYHRLSTLEDLLSASLLWFGNNSQHPLPDMPDEGLFARLASPNSPAWFTQYRLTGNPRPTPIQPNLDVASALFAGETSHHGNPSYNPTLHEATPASLHLDLRLQTVPARVQAPPDLQQSVPGYQSSSSGLGPQPVSSVHASFTAPPPGITDPRSDPHPSPNSAEHRNAQRSDTPRRRTGNLPDNGQGGHSSDSSVSSPRKNN